MSLKNLSTIPGNNTLAPPYGAPESSTKLKDFNDIIRQLMADTRTLAASNTIASAATTDLGSLDETFLTISGTTTITSFGTVSAGIYKLVTFSGALTLTHNATSLILLTGANRTTVAGDCGLYLSLGGGNWKEYMYSQYGTPPSYQPLDATLTALAGALTGANKIPYATGVDTLGELTRTIDGTLAGNSDTNIPTEKAVKTYADTKNIATQVAPGTSGNVLTSNGTAWVSGTGSTTLVSETSVAAGTASVTVSGLDIGAHKGYRIEIEYINGTATGHGLSMYVNGLTTATDYYRQAITIDDATVTTGRANNAEMLYCDASDRTYALINLNRMNGDIATAISSTVRGYGAGTKMTNYTWSKSAGVANITSLTFTAGVASGIGAGTIIRIYRKDK